MIKISLLMCIYSKENPLFLKRCLDSINNQTVLPDEIVIVKDGVLTPELEEILKNHKYPEKANAPIPVNIISLPENVTLGPARAAGVEAAQNDWIAIMDSDDICKPDRFEKQIKMIESNPQSGLIGGQIAEFTNTPNKQKRTANRMVPTDHSDIVNFAKLRNPFNHMTVMLKKEEALKAGNYRYFPFFEDYDLWTRMIKNGTICANHPDVLVEARTGSGTFERRRGTEYIRMEWRMQKQLKTLGLINTAEFIRNMILRIPVRLLPSKWLAPVYRNTVRSKAGTEN